MHLDHASPDPTPPLPPHVLHLNKSRVELSPTREELRNKIGFIKSDDFKGLIFPFDIRKAEPIITYINKYIYKYYAA